MHAVLFPVLFKSSVVIFPSILILLFPIPEMFARLIVGTSHFSHDDNLLSFFQISAGDRSMVEVHIAEISSVFEGFFLIEADQVVAEVVPLEEDGRVVIKVQIKQRDVLSISIVLEGREGLIPDFEHDVAKKLEEYLGRGEFTFLFDFGKDIVDVYIDIVQHSLSLQAQSKSCVWLCLFEFVLFDTLIRVCLQELSIFLIGQKIARRYFVEMNVWTNGVGSQLIYNAWIFTTGITKNMRSSSHEIVKESLERLDRYLLGIQVDDIQLLFSVLLHGMLLLEHIFFLLVGIGFYGLFGGVLWLRLQERQHREASEDGKSSTHPTRRSRRLAAIIRRSLLFEGTRLLLFGAVPLLFKFLQLCNELQSQMLIS